ncbi:hypothetical protein B0H19DRAFT_1382980 [Mycena capillaripes]|nr:hypothetical protein B0H19DRAFT_1382980 [Mycena capillaripes]
MDEMNTAPEESVAQASPGVEGGTYNAAVFNTAARDMIMIGCTTTSNFITTMLAEPSDFRRIPLGDICLQREICLHNNSGFVNWRRSEQCSIRRVYFAKIDGRKSNVMVAMYQGDDAEEEWRQDIADYMIIRHVPHFTT